MKEVISRKGNAHKAMCRNSTDKNGCKGVKNKAMKVVSKAMRVKAEVGLTE